MHEVCNSIMEHGSFSVERELGKRLHPMHDYDQLKNRIETAWGRRLTNADIAEHLGISERGLYKTMQRGSPRLGYALREMAEREPGHIPSPDEALSMWSKLLVSRRQVGRVLGTRGATITERLRLEPKPALVLAVAWLYRHWSMDAIER